MCIPVPSVLQGSAQELSADVCGGVCRDIVGCREEDEGRERVQGGRGCGRGAWEGEMEG